MTVSLVVVSHSEKIADGAVELAAQMAPDVRDPGGRAAPTDGRIGTSLEKVMAALDKAAGGDGVVVLADLGSAVMTAESAMEFVDDPEQCPAGRRPPGGRPGGCGGRSPGRGRTLHARKAAPPRRSAAPPRGPEVPAAQVAEGSVTGPGPDFTGDFELINQAGMHARPAAKIAGGLSLRWMPTVTVNGVDGGVHDGADDPRLPAGDPVLHVEAWGAGRGTGRELHRRAGPGRVRRAVSRQPAAAGPIRRAGGVFQAACPALAISSMPWNGPT